MAVSDPRDASAASGTDAGGEALLRLAVEGVPLAEGKCPRCRGMRGIYVSSNGGRTFLRCPECKGTGDA